MISSLKAFIFSVGMVICLINETHHNNSVVINSAPCDHLYQLPDQLEGFYSEYIGSITLQG